MKLHIKESHYQCDVCKQQNPYLVFKDLTDLKEHFARSHFVCRDSECLQDVFVVFGTETELDYHNDKVHKKGRIGRGGKSMYDAGSLLGVRLNDDEDNDGYYLKNQQGGGRGGRGGR